MNVRELKAEMVRQGKTTEELCGALGISKSAWFRKMSGTSQFDQGEISVLRSELNLDAQQTITIFFAENVS